MLLVAFLQSALKPQWGMATETPIYEETMALLTEAMNAAGIAIEEYVAPPSEEDEAATTEA